MTSLDNCSVDIIPTNISNVNNYLSKNDKNGEGGMKYFRGYFKDSD